MKYLTTTFLVSIFSILVSNAQSLKVEYMETIDLSEKLKAIEDPAIRQLVLSKTSKARHFQLVTDKGISVYQASAETNNENDSDNGVSVSIQSGDIIYKNHRDNKIIKQTNFMSRFFLITDKLTKPKWQITDENSKIGNYLCKKAILKTENSTVTAWFTEDIPSNEGPSIYFGLPGLILKVKSKEIVIEATKISPLKQKTVLKAPTKGKKVSQKEFEKIVIEKSKNLGGGNNENGVTIIKM